VILGFLFMFGTPVDVLLLGRGYPAMIRGDQLIVWHDILLLKYRWLLVAAAVLLPALALGVVHVMWRRDASSGRLGRWVRRLWPAGLLPIVAIARLLADVLPPAVVTNIAFYLPVAVLAAILAPGWRASTSGNPAVSHERRWNAGIVLLAVLLFYAVGWNLAVTTGEHVGDEGHYLVQAESLYLDHDLDIKNQLFDPDLAERTSLGPQDLTRQHVAPNSKGGHWYSWHPYGLPLILAPFWKKGIDVRYLILAIIGALGCLGMFRLSRRVGAGHLASAVAVAGLGGSFYWAVFSGRAMPEVLGATLLIWLFWAVHAQAEKPWLATFVAAGCCAYLAPSHVRFLPLSLMGMGFFGLFGLCGRQPWPTKLIRLTVFSLLCLAGYAGYYAVQRMLFGSSAFVYGTAPVSQTLFSFPLGMWATIADVQGLVSIFPLFMWLSVALLAWLVVDRKERFFAISLLVTFLTCLLTSCSNAAGIGGSSVSGRYLLVAVPLLVPAAAIMLERSSGWARGWFLFLGLASALLLLLTMVHLPAIGRAFILPVPSLRGVPSWQGLFQPHSTFLDVTLYPFAARWTTAYVIAGMAASLWLMLRPALSRRGVVGALLLVLALGIISHNVQAEYDMPGYRPRDVAQGLLQLNLDRVVVTRSAAPSLRFCKFPVAGDERSMLTNAPARPPDDWRYVDSSTLVAGVDGEGKSCREILTDAVMDTHGSAFTDPTNLPTLTFMFDRAVPLCGIRFLSPNDRYPREVMVEGQAQEGGKWDAVLPAMRTTGCFWSGAQVLPRGVQYFLDLRFAAPAGGIRSVRVTLLPGDTPHDVRLSEMLFLEQASPPEGEPPSFDACVTALQSRGVKQFYGPRWVSDRLAVTAARDNMLKVPALIPDSPEDWMLYDPADPCPVRITDTTGFLVDARDAGRARHILQGMELPWKEAAFGRFVLLVVAGGDPRNDARQYPMLYWTEAGCFAADRNRFAGRKAYRGYEEAVGLRDLSERVKLLKKAVELYPACEPAWQALIAALKAQGDGAGAAAQMAARKAALEPAIPARIRFANGIELLGLALSAQKAKPGGSVEVTYYWRCPPAAESTRPAVFVHFVQGKQLFFQDDHKLLDEFFPEDLRNQPFNEILTERRTVIVPASAPPGVYDITIGLYNPKNKRRLRAETALPEKRREVRLPVKLTVEL